MELFSYSLLSESSVLTLSVEVFLGSGNAILRGKFGWAVNTGCCACSTALSLESRSLDLVLLPPCTGDLPTIFPIIFSAKRSDKCTCEMSDSVTEIETEDESNVFCKVYLSVKVYNSIVCNYTSLVHFKGEFDRERGLLLIELGQLEGSSL